MFSRKSLVAFALAYSAIVSAVPTPVNEKRQNVPGAGGVWFASVDPLVALDEPTGVPVPPPGASGSVYGSSSLDGPDGNPINTADSAEVPVYTLVPGQTAPSTEGLYLDFSQVEDPQPIRGSTEKSGGTRNGPDTSRYDRMLSDVFASPNSDTGNTANSQWPMGLSHNRLGLNRSGWARQQNIDNLPAATAMAGVDMKLEPNAYRELHWHQAGEWAFVFTGSVRVATVNQAGQNYVDDLNAGDVWFFPPGVPHSLQAHGEGVEFLLVFDDGAFSEDSTSLVSEMFLRNPASVLAKNFKMDISDLKDTPTDQLYIFPGTAPPDDIQQQNVTGPAGFDNQPDTLYTYHWSQQQPMTIPGAGSVKILDSTTFPAASDMAAALVTIEPGAMRELHWHLDSDEWNFFLSGQARITVYQAPASGQTFDYAAGDVGYIPQTSSHYIENTGSEPVVLLEMLRAPKFTDISVAQWLGLTPSQIVKDTLHLPDQVIANLPKYHPYLIAGNPNLTTTNFTGSF